MQRILFFSLALVLLFGSCKEHTLISTKVSPVNDTAILQADTFYNCITHTFYNSDVITSTSISGISVYHGIGIVEDSFFGITNASAYFQVIPPASGLSFDTSWHFDSAFLYMPYSNFSFGDTTDKTLKQAYQVYYMKDSIGYNTYYYPTTEKAIDIASPLSAPQTVNLYQLQDSINIAGTNHSPGMRLKLNLNSLLPKITNAITTSSGDSDEFQVFINSFNGICVRPADSRIVNKVLPHFRLDGGEIYDRSAIHIYYHRSNGEVVAPLEFYFYGGYCAHFNKIQQDYSRYPVQKLFSSTQPNDNIVALQNKPGAAIDVKIFGINTQIPKGVLINKAQIQFSLISELNNATKFPTPDQLFVMGVGNGIYPTGVANQAEYYIEDRKPLGSLSPYTILDGTAHSFTVGTSTITTYTMGIPREVMASIREKNDTLHLHIQGSQLFYASNRMIAAGGNYPDQRFKTKFIVVYSTLKN